MKINQKIKLIRIKAGLTQSKFAQLIGLADDRSVREVESGKRKEIGSAKLEKICNLFPEYALWLMTDIDDISKVNNQSLTNPIK